MRFLSLSLSSLTLEAASRATLAFAPSRGGVMSSATRRGMMLVRSMTTTTSVGSSTDRLFPQELNILYDSKCSVCKLEIDFLRRRDERLNGGSSDAETTMTTRLKFTDLESSDFNEQDPANGGIDYETGMKAMHAVMSDGKVVQGVPVFKLAYEQVELGWLFRVAEVPGLSWLFDRAYDVFAAYRTIITRGTTVPTLVEAYREKQKLLKDQAAAEDCESCNSKEQEGKNTASATLQS